MKREGIADGSFVFVSATGLLATWWAYKRRLIQFRDLRVWLASHELLAQRWFCEKGQMPRFHVEDLAPLVGGVGGEHFRASLRRLGAVGLLSWSESRIDPTHSLAAVRAEEEQDLHAFVESVTNHKRKIPVPRRLLKFLSCETRPVLVATALGHLLRCMYYRKRRCSPSGLCKASWIASVFTVDERNVKAARQELETLGILIRERASQYCLNRWGLPMRFNLEWESPYGTRQTPPRTVRFTTETPPLRETGNSSYGRSENQEPARPVPGVRKRTGRGPSLRHITELDLTDPRRTLELHRQAAAAGLVGLSEAERLKVLALAAHARTHAKRNAPGLFASNLRAGRWYLALADEDNARKSLRSLECEERTSFHSEALPQALSERRETRGEIRAIIARSLGLALTDKAPSKRHGSAEPVSHGTKMAPQQRQPMVPGYEA